MDRPNKNYKRKKFINLLLVLTVVALSGWVLFRFLPNLTQASVSKHRIRKAIVKRGKIESTLSATGVVVPEFEKVVSSPVDARVIRILKRVGTAIKQGEPILELDTSQSVLAIEKLDQALSLKANKKKQLEIDLKEKFVSLQSQIEIKRLDLEALKTKLLQNNQLFQQGLLSNEKLEEIKLAERKAAIELKQLELSKVNAEHSTERELEAIELEIESLKGERREAKRQLSLATTDADKTGVLTWVVSEEGMVVRKGDVIARIADLKSFRVMAQISDVHAQKLYSGLEVSVVVNNQKLTGSIDTILPAIKDGIVSFLVKLDQKSNPTLKSNLRVDIFPVVDSKDNVLLIPRGGFNFGTGKQNIFILRNGLAVKTRVSFGISNIDNIEIVEGLEEGDEVIISDMSDYMHLSELKVR
ncbi:MAG: efflux RND transporter periplasmic adaptor subunit [Blastocatellia bacterium]|nr:efflux RND transporter periplasmic adaptor subunit [Blastocatellia bacterium]